MSPEDYEQSLREAVSHAFDRCEDGRHYIRKDEILTTARHAELVERKLGADAEADEGHGLVCFRGLGGRSPHELVQELRTECAEKWEGWTGSFSANHLVGLNLDPATGEVVRGQPITLGSPEGKPSVVEGFPATDRPDSKVGRGVRVGSFDTGVTPHPFLNGAYLAQTRDVEILDANRDRVRDTQAGHGTFIAGLILQQAPGATVVAKRLLSSEGFTDSNALARAIFEMGDAGIDVLNLSMGFYTCTGGRPFALELALAYLGASTVVVAAAGNHRPEGTSSTRPFYPAAFEGVLAVGATEAVAGGLFAPAPFSNSGPWVDVWARGADVISTFVGAAGAAQPWARWSGTSFAAPIVAGAIAARMTEDGGIPAPEAKRRLLRQAGVGVPATGAVLDLWPPARSSDPGVRELGALLRTADGSRRELAPSSAP